ncbi:FHA domain-containing protein [Mediterraneibacter gnavus]|uniref:FHA domain-containing protein n=1 Tax=Mediterraneibacter gnavus TaxID=33038 RepID=UPI0032BF5C2B
MLYWVIIGILIAAIIAVIFFTISKLLKEKKDYNQFERRYHSEDDYDDDYDDEEDDEEEEDDYEPEPRRRPVREQAERRTSSASAKRRWKIILEDVDQQDQYSFIFYDSLGIGRVSASSEYDKFLSLPEDLRVSKVHCAIIRSGDKLYLRDEGSKNHTYLNGKQIHKPIVIQKEDVITVGETRLEVVKILRETR